MWNLNTLWGKQVTKAFGRWAPTYTKIAEGKIRDRGYSYEFLAQFIWSHLGAPQTGIVVEMGCGTGLIGKRIPRSKDITLAGLDISAEMLGRIPVGIYDRTICASAESVPLPSAKVTGLFSAFMLHSVLNRRNAIQEMHRLLVSGGIGIIVDLFPAKNGLPIISSIQHFFHSLRYESGAPANYVTSDNLSHELIQAGLDVLQVEQLGMSKSYCHKAVKFRKPIDRKIN